MLFFSHVLRFALTVPFLVPTLTTAFVHQNVSIKLFRSTGQVKIVTSEMFYKDIIDLTNRSLAINAIAQNITVLNGPLGVVGLGPYPQVIQGMADLITASQSYLLTIYSTPKIYDAPTVTNITSAYQSFIVAHAALMQTLINRAGLFAVVPAIGNSLSQAINLDLVLVRGFWAALYHTYPDAQAKMAGNQKVLEFFAQTATQEYQGLLKPVEVAALNTQILTPLAGAIGTVLSVVGSLVSAVTAVPADLTSLLGGVGAGVGSLAGGLPGGVSSLGGGLGGGIGSLVSGAGSAVGGDLGSALTGVGGGVAGALNSAEAGLGSALSGLGAGLGPILGGGKTSTSVPVTTSTAPSSGPGSSSSLDTRASSLSLPTPTPTLVPTTKPVLPLSLAPVLSPAPVTINIQSLFSSVSALSSSLLTSSTVASPSIASQAGISPSTSLSSSSRATPVSSTALSASIASPYTTTITGTYATFTTSPVLGVLGGLAGSTVVPVARTTTYVSTVTPMPAVQARGE